MPKILKINLFLIFCFASFFYARAEQEEQITITTYYPSPYGAYKQLQLYPYTQPDPTSYLECNDINEGALYYHRDQGLLICRGRTAGIIGISNTIWGMTNSSPYLVYLNDELANVGIGTNAPEDKLEIMRPAAPSAPFISLQPIWPPASIPDRPVTSLGAIDWRDDTGRRVGRINAKASAASSTISKNYNSMSFWTYNESLQEKMKIDDSGVGIGVSNSRAPLEVKLPAWTSRDNNSEHVIFGPDSSSGVGIKFGYNSATQTGNINTNGDLILQDGGGNVGIGIIAPQKKLDILGGIKILGVNDRTSAIFSSSSYVDPHVIAAKYYNAKFGGSNNGIAVKGNSVFNGNIDIGALTPQYSNPLRVYQSLPWALTAEAKIIALKNSASSGLRQVSITMDAMSDDTKILAGHGDAKILAGNEDGNATKGYLAFYTNTNGRLTEKVRINSRGYVGVGTSNPTAPLTVVDDLGRSGTYSVSGWVPCSDRRLKTKISPLKGALGKVMGLNGVYFKWKNNPPNVRCIGLIAQDVEGVLPEVVSQGNDGYYSISYDSVVPVLVNAVKELNDIVDKQETVMKKQEAEIDRLEMKLK